MSKKPKPHELAGHYAEWWSELEMDGDGVVRDRARVVIGYMEADARAIVRNRKATDAQKNAARQLLGMCKSALRGDKFDREELKGRMLVVMATLSGLTSDANRVKGQQPRRGNGLKEAVKLAVKAQGRGDYKWTDIANWLLHHDWEHDEDWERRYPRTLFRVSKYTPTHVHYETHAGEGRHVTKKKLQEYIREAPRPR